MPEFTAQPLPANGTVDVAFKADYDGSYDLRAFRCPTSTFDSYTCTRTGEARVVAVYDEVVARIQGRALRGPATPFSVEVEPGGDASYDVEWEVVPAGQPDAAPLASGAEHDVVQRLFTLPLPGIGSSDSLVQGRRYRYQATLHTDRDPFGPLEGTVATEFEWDRVNMAGGIRLDVYDDFLGETIRNADVIYPGRDLGDAPVAWRDSVSVAVVKDAPEVMKRLELSITNSVGDVVMEEDDSAGRWDGRDFDRQIVPEGIYTIAATVVDRQDNAETYERFVRVSHERLAHRTREWTLTPRRTMIDKFVGRCASIQSPARAGWNGSIGLRSSASGYRCRTLEAQAVTTVHGIYLPDSPFARHHLYDQIRVSAYAGGAPGAKSAYLVHWYWSRGERWIGRKQFDRELGWHRGYELNGSNVVLHDQDNGRFFVIWSVGLAEGAKYDVKSFRVHFRYWALHRPPS